MIGSAYDCPCLPLCAAVWGFGAERGKLPHTGRCRQICAAFGGGTENEKKSRIKGCRLVAVRPTISARSAGSCGVSELGS